PLIHNLHGIIMKHGGDLKGAESAYRIAIAQALGKLPVAHYNRALVLEKLHKSRDAVQEYQNYLRDAPRGANAEKARRRVAMLMGKWSRDLPVEVRKLSMEHVFIVKSGVRPQRNLDYDQFKYQYRQE